jgi:hypothetical protein
MLLQLLTGVTYMRLLLLLVLVLVLLLLAVCR